MSLDLRAWFNKVQNLPCPALAVRAEPLVVKAPKSAGEGSQWVQVQILAGVLGEGDSIKQKVLRG